MVLLLLALGSMLLQGLNQQQRSLLAQTAGETQAIRETAGAHSALQWGKLWRGRYTMPTPAVILLPRAGAPACAFLTMPPSC
jgi:hypothetical protein